MTSAEFVDFLEESLGLIYAEQDLTLSFDALEGWDSVHLLRLMSALPASPHLGSLLEATCLEEIRLAVSA